MNVNITCNPFVMSVVKFDIYSISHW